MTNQLRRIVEASIVAVGIVVMSPNYARPAECPCPSPEPMLADICMQLDHMQQALHYLRKRDIQASSYALDATRISLGYFARNLKQLDQLFGDVIAGKVRYDRLDAFLNGEESQK